MGRCKYAWAETIREPGGRRQNRSARFCDFVLPPVWRLVYSSLHEDGLRTGDGAFEQKRPDQKNFRRTEEAACRTRFQVRREDRRTRNLSQRRTDQGGAERGLRSNGAVRKTTRQRPQIAPCRVGGKKGEGAESELGVAGRSVGGLSWRRRGAAKPVKPRRAARSAGTQARGTAYFFSPGSS